MRTKVKCLPLPVLLRKYLDLTDLVDLIPESQASGTDTRNCITTPKIGETDA